MDTPHLLFFPLPWSCAQADCLSLEEAQVPEKIATRPGLVGLGMEQGVGLMSQLLGIGFTSPKQISLGDWDIPNSWVM